MLLFINACIRGDASRTKMLCDHFLEDYRKQNPEETIEHVNLITEHFTWFDDTQLKRRIALTESGDFADPMFDAAKQFAAADKILIGAPGWDYSYPAVLKCYIENICAAGVTFSYTETGSVSLCKATTFLYITTLGGPVLESNCGYVYLRTLFSELFNIRDSHMVTAGMLDIVGLDPEPMLNEAKKQLSDQALCF